MSAYRVTILDSLDRLRAYAEAWDDLWRRSAVTWPTCRAELAAHWIEHFAPRRRLLAIVVEHDGQAVAALPLVARRLAAGVWAGALPNNPWSANGELLLDPATDVDAALAALLERLRKLPWPVFWFDDIPLHAPRWRQFVAALEASGASLECRARYPVAWLAIRPEGVRPDAVALNGPEAEAEAREVEKCCSAPRDWPTYQAAWSRRHRQNLARYQRRLGELGELRAVRAPVETPAQVEAALRTALTVEDTGWKGLGGTSVLRSDGMWEFLLRQCQLLAASDALDLRWLQCGDRAAAFALGLRAKGVHHSYKIGYDPHFAEFSPGQVLRSMALQEYFADPAIRAVDFLGPLTDAHRHWRPQAYMIGRVVTAPRWFGRVLVTAYRRVARRAKPV